MNLNKMTFGCEHEFGCWNAKLLSEKLPHFGRDHKDITCVSRSGIANDPKLKYYIYGGEINTPPTDTINGQAELLEEFLQQFPEASCNYRSNMHFHIHVPGLQDDLKSLKRFAKYNQYWLPIILPKVEPIPRPLESLIVPPATAEDVLAMLEMPTGLNVMRGALRRFNRRRKSHHTLVTDNRVDSQLAARTPEEFFEAEVPRDKANGRPMWHLAARAAVNLRQLLQTSTCEVRHWPGTLEPHKVEMVGLWCKIYTQCALTSGDDPSSVDPLTEFLGAGGDLTQFPQFEPYNHALEVRYRATVHDGTLSKECIAENIKAIEDGSFDDEYWNRAYNW